MASSDEFADAARTLAGAAAVMLGWPPDIFWAATPDDLAQALAPLRGSSAAHRPADRALITQLQERFPDD